jgi:flagellar motility protein MotE (MotC chaperone)
MSEEIEEKLKDLKLHLHQLSYKMRTLRGELQTLEKEYLSLFQEQERLQRLQIKPKIYLLKVCRIKDTTSLDGKLNDLVNKMSADQIRELLEELQGCEEEGRLIEYEDADEIYELTDGV